MEKKQILLELVCKEIDQQKKKLEELKILQKELQEQSGKQAVTRKRGSRPNSEAAHAANTMLTLLSVSSEPMSPSEIVEASEKRGMNLKANLVRQVLSRDGGQLFHSPKRGFWELKGDATKEGENKAEISG